MPIMRSMDPQEIIAKIERYSAMTGLKVSTICQKAFRNPHYLDRLNSRLDRLKDEAERLDRFMAENPPAQTPEGATR